MLYLSFKYFNELVYLFFDIFFIFSILFLICYGLFLKNIIKTLYLNQLIIDLSIPIIFINFLFFYLYIYNDLNLQLFLNLDLSLFIIVLKMIIILLLFFFIIISRNSFIFDKIFNYEYILLILLSIEGTFIILMTKNLFFLFLAIEIQTLCFYILAGINRYNNFSTEASLKYFLFGSFSSGLLLFGISYLYGIFGTLDIYSIHLLINYMDNNLFLFFVLFIILCGVLFKLGVAPMHWWLPDVYEGSPTIITLFFSIFPKIALILILIKFNFFLFFFEFRFFNITYLVFGLLSMIVGFINALYQVKIKRFLAFSSIFSIGLILVNFCDNNYESYISSIIYIITYLMTLILVFYFIIYFRLNAFKEIYYIFEFDNYKNNKVLIFFFSLILFSLVGIPPLCGFFGKFFIFYTFILNYNYLLLIIVFFINIMSSFYYIRLIRFIFFSDYIYYYNILINELSLLFIILIIFNCIFFFFLIFFLNILLH